MIFHDEMTWRGLRLARIAWKSAADQQKIFADVALQMLI
jgi:hypothetical protein